MFVSEEINRANQKFFEKTFGYDPKLLDTFPVLSPDAIDTSRVSAELETFKRTAAVPVRFLPSITSQDIPFYYEQLEHQFDNTMCIAPWVRATITPKGNVTPCIGYIIGNVLEQRFTKIWNSQRYRTFRAELQKRGIFPGCVRCCHRRY